MWQIQQRLPADSMELNEDQRLAGMAALLKGRQEWAA
jgi:hypothetical protein